MNKKFLSILTGVSALAVAGLLSIIPASVSHAAPSQAPATVNTTIHVEDHRSGYAPVYSSPYETNVNCEFEYSYSGNATSVGECSNLDLQISIFDDAQVNYMDVYGEFPGNLIDGNISGTFRFTYDGMNYAASMSTDLHPVQSLDYTFFDVAIASYYIYATVPPAPTDNPVAPSEDPASVAFNAAIDNTVNEIGLAVLGLNADGSVNETRTVQYKSNYAISPKIIAALAKAENVTFIYTFEYEGIIFQSFITPETAAAMYSPTIAWYGPCYIATYSPTVPIGFVK